MIKNFTKLFLYSLISTTFLMSCNNDDNDSGNSKSKEKVIKSLKINALSDIKDGVPIYEIEKYVFYYDDQYKKLLKIENLENQSTSLYNYQDDKLTSIDSSHKNILSSTVKLFYTNSKVAYTLTYEDNNMTERHDYIYNAKSQLIQENICTSSGVCPSNKGIKYTYDGDNVIQLFDNSWIPSWLNSEGMVHKYTYKSTANNPFKNTQEELKIFFSSLNSISKQNIETETSYYNWHSNEQNTSDRVVTYTYTYDKDNFPVKVVGLDNKGQNYTTMDYEYYE